MRLSLGVVFVSLCCSVPVSLSAQSSQLDRVRAALDKYKSPVTALADGYLSTLVCVEYPASADAAGGQGGQGGQGGHAAGGMGVHFLNPGLIGPTLDTLKPQVLIYEPVGDSLKLVAAEWFVPVQVSAAQPELFGRKFDGPMEGHAPIMPPSLHHWDLHVWLWKPNPSGMFTSTNPAIKCPARGYTVQGRNVPVTHGH